MKKELICRICSYVSLAISIVLLFLWCCNVGGFQVVNLDTFVAVIIALLAIIVTIVLGWQIYNTIELKEKMKELDILKNELNEQKKNVDQLSHKTSHMIGLTWGENSLEKEIYPSAFYYLIFALKSALLLENPVNIDIINSDMNKATAHIKKGDRLIDNQYNDVINKDKELRTLNNYCFIKEWYEPMFKIFVDNVNV